MNKNNIMINFNPKNVNVNIEKLKVQKKLSEYQKLIDQKLNELILSKHPHIKGNKKEKEKIKKKLTLMQIVFQNKM